MSYKYFGRLAGKTNADVALAHTSPASTHTPFSPQAPATKFLSYGENSTSLAFNRVMAAISTNLDYFAGILDSPALRDDVLTPLINGTLDADGVEKFQAYGPGFSVLRAFSGTYLSLGVDGATSKKCPPTWVFVGLHKSALDRRIRAYSRLDTQSQNGGAIDQFRTELMHPSAVFADGGAHFVSPGTQIISPVGVKLYNDAALGDYYDRAGVSQQVTGEEHHGVPKWIPPIQATKPDLPPYNRTIKNLRIDGWTEDGPIIGGEGESLSDAYMRPGCFLNIFNANDANGTDSNNGLYRIAHIEKSLDSSAGGKGDKVVLTRGGLHKVTVETSSLADDFEAGDLIYWSSKPDHADGTKHFTANKYAYVAYIIDRPDLSAGQDLEKKDLYLATFSGAEDFSGQYANGSYLGSQTGIQGGRLSMNDVGLADQEEDASQHWLIPNGTKLYSANSAANAPVGTTEACIPAGYPVKFRTNLSTKGSATPHNPLGFVLNPTLKFEGAGLNSADYYIQCRTLTTVKEKLVSAGTSPNAYANDDPSAKLGFTESDARALTAFTKMTKLGSYWKDGNFAGKFKYTNSGGNQGLHATVVAGSLALNSGFSSSRNVLGGCLWRLTLTNPAVANHVFATEEGVEAGQVIWFKHPVEDDAINAYAHVISVDENALTLWGGFRVLQNNAVAAWDDPIVTGSIVTGLIETNGNAVALNNATWEVESFSERPYVLSSTGHVRVPHMGLDSAYHADTSQGHTGPGSGNRMWLVPGKPVELMMPGDWDGNGVPDGQTAFSVKSDSYEVNLLLNSLRTGSVHAGIRQWVRTTFAEGNAYPDTGASTALEFTDVNAQTASDIKHRWVPLTSARNKHFGYQALDLWHVQDKSILGGISAGILGSVYASPGVVSYAGDITQQTAQAYSAFSTRIISGCNATGGGSDITLSAGVFTVLGAKCHFKGGHLEVNHTNWTFVYVDFADSHDSEPVIGETQNPKSFSHPTRVYLYRCQRTPGNTWYIEDMRSFANRIDAKMDIYVGRTNDIYSHHDHTPQEIDANGTSIIDTGTTDEESKFLNNSDYYSQATHFGSLRAAFQYIESLETYKRTQATWPGSLETVRLNSDYYTTAYTVHVVSDTFEAVPTQWVGGGGAKAAVLRIPTSGITVQGHLPGHKGGIITDRAAVITDDSGRTAHYEKDTRPMLPTVSWNVCRPLIDFGGHGGVVIKDLSFRWELPATTNDNQNSDSWDVDYDNFGPNSDGLGGSMGSDKIMWSDHIYSINTTLMPKSILFVNQQTGNTQEAFGIAGRVTDADLGYYDPEDPLNATATNLDEHLPVKTSSQMGDILISRVSLVGGSGFLWFDSTQCPSYRNIIIEDCEARRVTDLGIHIQGGSGQLYTEAYDPFTSAVFAKVARNEHSPHEKVVIRGCMITQYGHNLPVTVLDNSRPEPLHDAETTASNDEGYNVYKRYSWRCRSSSFGAGIHVSCAREILVEDNTVTAEFSWMKPTYLDSTTNTLTDIKLDRDWLGTSTQLGFNLKGDTAGNTIGEDLRKWFDNTRIDTKSLAAFPNDVQNSLNKYCSLHRVIYIETPDVSQSGFPTKANTENGLGYITVGRLVGSAEQETWTDWFLETPEGACGKEMGNITTLMDTWYPSHHTYPFADMVRDGFEEAGGNLTTDPRFFVGLPNYWRAGIEVGRSPSAHPYVKDPSLGLQSNPPGNPMGDVLSGYSLGTPYMPVRTYVGKQDVVVRNNNISFVIKQGVSAEGSQVAITGNSFSAFSNGIEATSQEAFPETDSMGLVRIPHHKAAIYALSPVVQVKDNAFKPTFLGLDFNTDRDFEAYEFEYPSLGRFKNNSFVETIANNSQYPRPIYIEADNYVLRPGKSRTSPVSTYHAGSEQVEIQPGDCGQYSDLTVEQQASASRRGAEANTVVSGNMGFPITLDLHHGIISNNNTQGGDIKISAPAVANLGGKLSYTINSNILGATFRSIAGSIDGSEITNATLTSSIITDNNLQSLDRLNDGTITPDFDAAACWIAHNLPKHVNAPALPPVDVYPMSPRIMGPYDGVEDNVDSTLRAGIPAAIWDWGINNEAAVIGGDNVPRAFSGYTRTIHVVTRHQSSVYPNNPQWGWPITRVGVNAKNRHRPFYPSMTLFGNPFKVGVNPGGAGGACDVATYKEIDADDGYGNYSNHDNNANSPFPEGFYTNNLACSRARTHQSDPQGQILGPDDFGTVWHDFVERRPYWHIFNDIQQFALTTDPADLGWGEVPCVFSVFLEPKTNLTVPLAIKQITLNLKIVWAYNNDDDDGMWATIIDSYAGPPSRAEYVSQVSNNAPSFAITSTAGVIDHADYPTANYSKLRQSLGIRAFINRPHGTKDASGEVRPTRENVGQWIAHNLHKNVVDEGTVDGSVLNTINQKHRGAYFEEHGMVFGEDRDGLTQCIYEGSWHGGFGLTPNLSQSLSWDNNFKIARVEDGFNQSNYGLRLFVHSDEHTISGISGIAIDPSSDGGPSGAPNPFTASKWSCSGIHSQSDQTLVGHLHHGSHPTTLSTGDAGPNDDEFLNDGFIDVPLSMKVKHFSTAHPVPNGYDATTGLGPDVDNIITKDDTIELQFYTWNIPRLSAGMSVRVSSITVEYENPGEEKLRDLGYEDER